jgi:hypothetical protein
MLLAKENILAILSFNNEHDRLDSGQGGQMRDFVRSQLHFWCIRAGGLRQ